MARNRRDTTSESDVLFDERPPQIFYVPQGDEDEGRLGYEQIQDEDDQHSQIISPLQRQRSVTNSYFLLILRIFLISWIVMVISAFIMGNLQNLQPPVDSEGRRCGVDIQVKDKPFLFLFDVSKYNNGSYSTNLTCIAECPQTAFVYKRNATQDVISIMPKLICKEGIDLQSVKNWNELDKYIKEGKCAEFYLESTPLFNRCVPNRIPDELKDRISNKTVEQLKTFIKVEIAKGSLLQYLFVDGLVEAKYILLGFTLMAAALSIIYVLAFAWLGKIFVLASVYILNVAILFGIYRSAEAFSVDKTQIFWLIVSIALVVIFAFFILSFYYARRRSITCEIIGKSCSMAGLSYSSLCIPILVFALCLLLIILSTLAVLYLSTITYDTFKVKMSDDGCICPSSLNYTDGVLCDPDTFMRECRTNINGTCFESGCRHFESYAPGYITFMEIVCWCGYWLVFLMVLFSRTVLAGAFAEYYWTSNKSLVPRFTLVHMIDITMWYHFGSFLIGSVYLVLEIFMDSLTRFTFSVMAIYGENYRKSYKSVVRYFGISVNNHIFCLFDQKLKFWLRTGTLSIASLTTGIAWCSCASFFEEDSNAHANIMGIPIFLLVIGIVSYFIAYLMLEVLKTATVTVCICFMDDNERNMDSAEQNYAIPRDFLNTIKQELENVRASIILRS